MEAFFEHSKQASSSGNPPSSASLGSYIFAGNSPLYDDLPENRDRFRVTSLARAFSGWTGAELEEVSFRWWGFERETMGPDRLVTGGNYGRVTKYLAGKCRELRLNTVVEKVRRKEGEGQPSSSVNWVNVVLL